MIMLKKSKVVALLVVCVMMFAVVEPALAWFDTDKQVEDAKDYAFWGAIAGGVLAVCTGGLSLIPTAIAAGTGAALGGAYGAANDEQKKEIVDGAIIAGSMIIDDIASETQPAN